jgi:NAD+ synthase (glutamine-hydrolysing)
VVLTTGNKSEMATGYCTLYGDMAGGFAVIKDVLKTLVFAWRAGAMPTTPYGTGANPIPSASSPVRPAPSCARIRRTRTACRRTRCWMPSSSATWKMTSLWHPCGRRLSCCGCGRVRLIRINEYKRRQAGGHPCLPRSFARTGATRSPTRSGLKPVGAPQISQPSSGVTHYEITAIIKPFKLEEVREALAECGVTG